MSRLTADMSVVVVVLARTTLGVLLASISASAALASVMPIPGVLAAKDAPAGERLIVNENVGASGTADGLRTSVSHLKAWGYRDDYSVQFLGLLHGSIVGIVSSVVRFDSETGAHDSVAFTASHCATPGSGHFTFEHSVAPDAYLCVARVTASGATLIEYGCVWSHKGERQAVSLNVAATPTRPPGTSAAQAEALTVRLARIQTQLAQ